MPSFETLFWLFFAGCAAWIGYGILRMFLWDRSALPPPQMPVRAKSAGGGMGSTDVTTVGVNTATAPVETSGVSIASSESYDSDSTDSSSDSGGGDFSGGGGDYGGGGSSGSWS